MGRVQRQGVTYSLEENDQDLFAIVSSQIEQDVIARMSLSFIIYYVSFIIYHS